MTYLCVSCQKEFTSQEALEQHNKLAHATPESSKIKPSRFIGIVVGIIIVLAAYYLITSFSSSVPHEEFAKCIAATGAKFYGAFWCSHCIDQKNLFGSGAKYLPYIECSAADRTENPECLAAGVTSYPTWVFADGSRTSGLSLEQLAQRTGCTAPAS